MNKPAVQLTYTEPDLPKDPPYIGKQDTMPFTALTGKLRRVLSSPDWTPRQYVLEEQFAIYVDGTGNRILYVYDFAEGGGWYSVRLNKG